MTYAGVKVIGSVGLVKFSNFQKSCYLPSVPVSRIQNPDNVARHYYGRYADTGYGGCFPQECVMHSK